MNRTLFLIVVAFFLALECQARPYWTGGWHTTIAPLPSLKTAGGLRVILNDEGTLKAELIYDNKSVFQTESGTWTQIKPGEYQVKFTLQGFVYTGTIRNNFLSGTWKGGAYKGRFQCTMENDGL